VSWPSSVVTSRSTRSSSSRHGITTLELQIETPRATTVSCTDATLSVALADGRVITTPLWWYPRLHQATPAQRARYEIMPLSVHWPDIDEDLSILGMLTGARAPGAVPPAGGRDAA
jgi:Protein of unknown function (DUF2442)